RVLSSCPDQPVPDDDGGVTVPVAARPAPKPKAEPKPEAPAMQEPADGGDVFYQNCSAVRAAGKAPIRAGDPGWEPKFDRDGDGVGCE
ncbi:excalibur calcium-binding domain-containing protein, partial [Arthrobacter mobilis]